MLTFEVTYGKSKTTITLGDDSTVGELRSALEQWSHVPAHAQKITGPIGLNKTPSAKLTDCGAKAGERNKFSIFGTALLSKAPAAQSSETSRAASAAAASGGGLIDTHSEVFKEGSPVEILGLKTKPELNGCKGRVLGQDSSSGRWIVQVIRTGEICKFKTENMKLIVEDCAAGAVSGRTAFGGFSNALCEIAQKHLEQFIQSQSITRLAELAFDPKDAVEQGLWGRARFCSGSPEVEKEVFLGQLEEMVLLGKRMTSTFICDVSLVREGLKRIYAGSRSLSDVLCRKPMCPLDIPLLRLVLISVKMIEFIKVSPQWLPAKHLIFRAMFSNAAFAERCGLLAFPSLARFPGGRNAHGSISEERTSICELMSSPSGRDFMKQLWAAGPRLSDPVAVSHLAQLIQAFDISEANDACICLYALEYATSTSQRDPVDFMMDMPPVEELLARGSLLISLKTSGLESRSDLDIARDAFFGSSSSDESIWDDRALAQAFKCAFEGGESSMPNFEELSKGITDVVYRAFFKNFCERCSKLYASDVPPIVTNVLLPRLRADSVILRAAALRWPRFAMAEAKAQRMRRFCAGGIEKERENCKKFLLDIGSKAFSPSCQVILDHIWDQAVPLDFVAVCQGISPVEPADAALARDIIESAKSIQAQAENAAAAGPCDDGDDAPEPASSSKRGSFGGCDISCSDDHYGMACDVCGVDYGWHQGHRCMPIPQHARESASIPVVRGSFQGCTSDCSARHERTCCDKCHVPWELHSRAHSGHGCNNRHQRASFQGCSADCTATHERESCDVCNRPWEVHVCGHYCANDAEHDFPVDLRGLLRGVLERSSSRPGDESPGVALPGHLLQALLGGAADEQSSSELMSAIRSLTGQKIRVDRSNLLESSIAAFQSVDKGLLSANFGIEFEGEDGQDAGGLFKEWMSETCKLLVAPPLFLPVFSQTHGTAICQRLNPLPEELGLQQPERHLRLLGVVLGLSVMRRIPIGENISIALAKQLLGQQPDLDDLQYELPEEFETLNVLKDKSKQELDEYFQVDARDDTLHHKFTTKSRIIQLHQTIEHIRAQVAYPPAQQLQMFSQFEQRFAEQVAIGGDDRVESKVYDHSPRADLLVPGESPRADGRRIVRGSNFKQYVQLTVNKLCVTNVKELLKHVTSAFNDVVPEEKRRRLTPSDLVDCWSGDIGLNSFQAVEKWKRMSIYDAHDDVTSWFWDIVTNCSTQLRSAVLQWSTGLRCLPLRSSSKFRIERNKDEARSGYLPTAQTCGGSLGQITLFSSASKDDLKQKLIRACEDMGFFIA